MTENTVEQKNGSRQENESGGQCETSSGVDQQIQITGQGSVRAVMTGYQMSGDSKKTVYEQIEVLREEKNAEVSLPVEQKIMTNPYGQDSRQQPWQDSRGPGCWR